MIMYILFIVRSTILANHMYKFAITIFVYIWIFKI